jgi:TadE-like protein
MNCEKTEITRGYYLENSKDVKDTHFMFQHVMICHLKTTKRSALRQEAEAGRRDKSPRFLSFRTVMRSTNDHRQTMSPVDLVKGSLRKARGQASVEFALVLTIAMIVLFVSVQLALIGQVYLSLGQMNYQGARYAAVHPDATATDVGKYMVKVGAPNLTKSCGAKLTTVTLTPKVGAPSSASGGTFCGDPAPGGAALRAFGDPVKIAITYDLTNQIFLANGKSGFLGIHFPTTLTTSESAMVE